MAADIQKSASLPSPDFRTTRWSVVMSVDRTSEVGHEALTFLCRTYWYPLYAYVRRTGRSHHDAQDLTQGFFARLLEKQYLESVLPAKGKFRSYLLCALKNYMTYEWKKAHTLKRGAGVATLSLDEKVAQGRYAREPADHCTPEALYDRSWAMALLDRTMKALEKTYVDEGKEDLFAALRPYVSQEQDQRPYAETAEQLAMKVNAVTVAVHRMRKKFADALRAEIADTVADPCQVEDELRSLFSSLS